MGYEYTDDSGDVVLITGHGDCAHISLGASTCCLISDQRQAAAQELAGDGFEVLDKGTYDNLIADGIDKAQAAQPDRPEPVDPASVPRAKAEALREAADSVDAVDGPGSIDHVPSWLRERADALDPAPAAVAALADALVGVGVTSAGPDALGYARALIRHRNVRVVSTNE